MTAPTTEAGRAFADRLTRAGLVDVTDTILAIEAEATAAAEQRLRSRIAALEPFGEATHDADWGWRDCRNAVLALLKEPEKTT